jgi:hypothetical protein
MQRWTSQPLAISADVERIASAHLELSGVRVDGPSFTFYVFLNVGEDSLPEDAGREQANFAAAATVFSSGECWGDDGHCDWKQGPVSPYDRRPQHHRTPVTLTLDVTDAVKALGNPDDVTVTIHAARPSDRAADDVLRFEQLSLHAYAAGADAPNAVAAS